MKIDRDSNMPLYIQFKSIIIDKLKKGEIKPGSILKTEMELCDEYGISRYPVRQAMDELVTEGYLVRVRGKGTFVSGELPNMRASDVKLLGLVMPNLIDGFNGDILSGFEKQARKRGYLTIACCSESSPVEELRCIDMLVENGASGIFVFPCDESSIDERREDLNSKGINLGIIDRNPGIQDIDYIGSDNFGGVYSAVRHLSLQGFRNAVFVSYGTEVSSVKERLAGYRKAVEDFNMNSAEKITVVEDIGTDKLQKDLLAIQKYVPVGIVATNDFIAINCMDILIKEGLIIGKDVAIVGFDNIKEGSYQQVPLTTVAQNGLLLGSTAADTAIDKLEGKANQLYRCTVPTQLVVRSSCGEKLG